MGRYCFKKETRSATSESTLLAIHAQLLVLEEVIETGENAIVEFQKRNNLVFIQEQGSTAGSSLARLKNRLAAMKSQLRELVSLSLEQHLEERNLSGEQNELVQVSVLQTSDNYKEAKLQYDRLIAERDGFSIYLKPKHPKMINFRLEIERAENMRNIYRKQGLEQLEEQKSVLQIRIANLTEEIAEWEQTSLDYSRLQVEYDRLQSQLQRSKNLYQRLLGSIQSIDLNLNINQETVTILEKATPAYPVEPDISRKVAEGGMAGIVLGAGLIFLIGVLDNRIVSADDISRRFEQPVMGLIPFEVASDNGRLEFLQPKDERHLFAEACRTLRSSLIFMETEGSQPRSFIITSAVPSEGKSTLAGNLAITLAFTSTKTLLVDADLRRGQLHKSLNLGNERGLSELVQDSLGIDEVIQKTAIENLDFISCGSYPERPGELLLNPRTDELLRDLGDRYEYIVFDSAPVLATDDTTSFATKVDAVIFAIRSSFTHARQVKSSLARLNLLGANVCGFILNCVDTKGADYYYYKKYQSYYYVAGGGTPKSENPVEPS